MYHHVLIQVFALREAAKCKWQHILMQDLLDNLSGLCFLSKQPYFFTMVAYFDAQYGSSLLIHFSPEISLCEKNSVWLVFNLLDSLYRFLWGKLQSSLNDSSPHVTYLFYMRPDDPTWIFQSQKHASDLNQTNSPMDLEMTSYWKDYGEGYSIISCQFFNASVHYTGNPCNHADSSVMVITSETLWK